MSPPVPRAKATAPWVKKSVRVDSRRHTRGEVVEAEVYGAFAVHRGLGKEGEGLWALTHEPTGRRIVLLATELDCKRLGELLWGKWCLLFRLKDLETLRSRLPIWMFNWLKECNTSRAVVDYTLFQERGAVG
jgi:hypothetical protein